MKKMIALAALTTLVSSYALADTQNTTGTNNNNAMTAGTEQTMNSDNSTNQGAGNTNSMSNGNSDSSNMQATDQGNTTQTTSK